MVLITAEGAQRCNASGCSCGRSLDWEEVIFVFWRFHSGRVPHVFISEFYLCMMPDLQASPQWATGLRLSELVGGVAGLHTHRAGRQPHTADGMKLYASAEFTQNLAKRHDSIGLWECVFLWVWHWTHVSRWRIQDTILFLQQVSLHLFFVSFLNYDNFNI